MNRVIPLASSMLLAFAGCAASSSSRSNDTAQPPSRPASTTDRSAAKPAPPIAAPSTPVAVSAVRERALEIIEASFKSADPQVRANAVEAAMYAPQRLSTVLEKGLRDPNPGVRSVAAMAVGKSRQRDLVALAGPLLADPSSHVRASAIFAHVQCGVDVDRNPLANMILEDPSPWVRRHVAFLLGEMGDRSAQPLLRAAAAGDLPPGSSEQTKTLQLQIAESLARLGDNNARQVLRASLYPSRPEELEMAALAVVMIGEIKDREAVDQLIFLAEHRDATGQPYPAEVRMAVAAALAGMGLRQGGFIAEEFLAHENPVLRAQSAAVYAQIGGREALGRLNTLMADKDERVRIAAAAGVLRTGTKPE